MPQPEPVKNLYDRLGKFRLTACSHFRLMDSSQHVIHSSKQIVQSQNELQMSGYYFGSKHIENQPWLTSAEFV